MTRNETKELGCNEKLFKQIVKLRSTNVARHCVTPFSDTGKGNPLSADPIFNKRPEQLSVEDFIELTNRVEQALATE